MANWTEFFIFLKKNERKNGGIEGRSLLGTLFFPTLSGSRDGWIIIGSVVHATKRKSINHRPFFNFSLERTRSVECVCVLLRVLLHAGTLVPLFNYSTSTNASCAPPPHRHICLLSAEKNKIHTIENTPIGLLVQTWHIQT